jgi:hypothetical protein
MTLGHARADGTAPTNDEGDRTKVYRGSSEHAPRASVRPKSSGMNYGKSSYKHREQQFAPAWLMRKKDLKGTWSLRQVD